MEFGERESGVEYTERPGAYGLAFNEQGHLLCVRAIGGVYLPGGGLLPGEAPEDGLARETREETGYAIIVGERIGEADQVVPAFVKRGVFFRMTVDGDQQPVGPFDHQAVWLPVEDALKSLSEEFQTWALRQAMADA